MKRLTISSFVFLFLLSCSRSKTNDSEQQSEEPKNPNYIVLTDEYSTLKGGSQKYEVNLEDSLIIDISEFDFVAPSEASVAFTKSIEYKERLIGTWAYVDIVLNDSIEVDNSSVTIEDNKVFYFDKALAELKTKKVKNFDLVFRTFIDNGTGELEVDRFSFQIKE